MEKIILVRDVLASNHFSGGINEDTFSTVYIKQLKRVLYEKEKTTMTRELIIQNIMNNYGKYGITQDMVEEVIDTGLEDGMSYDLIYLDMCRRISEITGEEFVCTSSDMARAFNVSDDEMDKIIKEARQELIEAGEDPDEYFREVPVHRFMM